jgi:hypothetical protein
MIPIDEMRRLFQKLESHPLRVDRMVCGKCCKELGTGDCDVCKDLIAWAKEQDEKQNKKN